MTNRKSANRIDYLRSRKNRDGTVRWYWIPGKTLHDRGWRTVPLAAGVTDPDAAADQARREAIAINARVREAAEGRAPDETPKRRGLTIDDIISRYRKHRKFRQLAPKTQRDYGQHLDLISRWVGPKPVGYLTAVKVDDYIEKVGEVSPAMAAATVRVGRLLWNHSARKIEGFAEKYSNPFARPDIETQRPDIIVWSPDEARHMIATADRIGHHAIGTAILINEWIGQREGDVIKIRTGDIRNNVIDVLQNKTNARGRLAIDVVPALVDRIEAEQQRRAAGNVTPIHGQLLLTPAGKPWRSDHFRHVFARIRATAAAGDRALGIPAMPSCKRLQFRQLRHTAVTRLFEAGVDIPGVASITLHEMATIHTILKVYGLLTEQLSRAALEKRAKHEQGSADF